MADSRGSPYADAMRIEGSVGETGGEGDGQLGFQHSEGGPQDRFSG